MSGRCVKAAISLTRTLLLHVLVEVWLLDYFSVARYFVVLTIIIFTSVLHIFVGFQLILIQHGIFFRVVFGHHNFNWNLWMLLNDGRDDNLRLLL